MTKTILLFSCLFCTTGAALAQSNYLKLYLGFELAQRPVLNLANYGQNRLVYQQTYESQAFYALAFAHEKTDGDFWEISGQTNAYFGFTEVYDNNGPDSIIPPPIIQLGEERNNYAQLQFEYNWLQCADNNQKVRPYLGVFLRAAGQWTSFQPSTSEYFPQKHWRVNLAPGFVPRLLIKAGKRWQLDLSAPIVLGHFGLEGSTIEDPALTHEQQRTSNFELSAFTLETQVRLGIAYNLNGAQ